MLFILSSPPVLRINPLDSLNSRVIFIYIYVYLSSSVNPSLLLGMFLQFDLSFLFSFSFFLFLSSSGVCDWLGKEGFSLKFIHYIPNVMIPEIHFPFWLFLLQISHWESEKKLFKNHMGLAILNVQWMTLVNFQWIFSCLTWNAITTELKRYSGIVVRMLT